MKKKTIIAIFLIILACCFWFYKNKYLSKITSPQQKIVVVNSILPLWQITNFLTSQKFQKINDPEEGIYPRITKMEMSLNSIKEKLDDHKKDDQKQSDLNDTTKQLQVVAGSKLEKLEKSVHFYENLSQFSWIIIGAFGIQLANIILTLLKK